MQLTSKSSSDSGSNIIQYVAMLSGALIAMSCGIGNGWSSPYLPFLLNSTVSYIPLTSEEGYWVAASAFIGAPIGAFSGAYLIDLVGRKSFLLALSPITSLCLLGIAFSRQVYLLIFVRLMIAAMQGAIYTALPMYFGEISSPNIRGMIGSSIAISALLGTIFINVIGPFTSITTSSLICLFIPIIHFITFIWMPESPYYLLKKLNIQGARKSLQILRRKLDVEVELQEIIIAVKRQEASQRPHFRDIFRIKSNRKAVYIYLILTLGNKCSGISPITLYTTTIFQAAHVSLGPVISVIIYSVIGLLATIFALFIVDKVGRRPLLLFSSLGCTLALTGEALYFTLKYYDPDVLSALGWLPLTALITYNVIFSMGLSFAPVLFLSELFPTAIKPKALCLADSFTMILAAVVSKYFQVMNDKIDTFAPFWTFAGCTLIACVLIYNYVPETKGKSLEQIQIELLGANNEN